MATKTFDRSDGLVRTLGDFVLDERLLWVRMFARCISCLTILPPRNRGNRDSRKWNFGNGSIVRRYTTSYV